MQLLDGVVLAGEVVDRGMEDGAQGGGVADWEVADEDGFNCHFSNQRTLTCEINDVSKRLHYLKILLFSL